jgi:hypothetical protein
MAKIRNIDGDAFLTDANGDFIDSDLTENDPLPQSEINQRNEPLGTADELIAELFPEVDLDADEITF